MTFDDLINHALDTLDTLAASALEHAERTEPTP
jgi:hypothetical protein